MVLSRDIYSTFNEKHAYGMQGDEVIVISMHDAVAIVEDKKGIRFPVTVSELTGELVIKAPVVIEQPPKSEMTIVAPPLKKKKQLQTQLF
jgi:hypothetical protein